MLRSNGPATTAELCCWPQAKSKKPINLTSPRNQPPIARCQENQPRAQTKRNTPRCQRNKPRCQRNKPRCQKKQPLNTHSGTAWRPCGTVMAHHQPNFGLVSFSRVIEKPTACTSWMGSAREAVGLNKCGLPRQTPRGQKSAHLDLVGQAFKHEDADAMDTPSLLGQYEVLQRGTRKNINKFKCGHVSGKKFFLVWRTCTRSC